MQSGRDFQDLHSGIQPGVVIAGRYRLTEQIGDGRMGAVWLASPTDRRACNVALRLIKPGMDAQAVLDRFVADRPALALMDHPNIAKVLDGGLTPDGRPFFVMELINGLPLTQYCDEARLTTRARLDLFVQVCQAVQHAHQKGIVHRDLKPSNILVTLDDGRPVPKVVDFGVAQATGGKLTDETFSTQCGALVGTLEYMSPELAALSAPDVDTRADIYSLGAILYELLTGLRPFDSQRFKKADFDEMARIIREEAPSRPSDRLSTDGSLPATAALRQTEPKGLTALLRAELDWVVMKCLEKQRDRRYETASCLVRDLRHSLVNEAVEAHPPSTGYTLTKFVQRNKSRVAAAALGGLLLAGVFGLVVAIVAQGAEQRRTANALVKVATEEAQTKPALEAETGARMETRPALAIQEQLVEDFDTVLIYRTELAGSYINVGRRLLLDQRSEDALEWYARAIPSLKDNLAGDPRSETDRLYLRNAYWHRAVALSDLQRHAEAVKDWDRAIELETGPARSSMRLQRAISIVRSGDHAQAAAEAEALAAGRKPSVDVLYDCACVFSLCSAGVKDDVNQPALYADRAVELLTNAVAAGYVEAAHMKQDDDLAALRARADFQQLIADLEKKAASRP